MRHLVEAGRLDVVACGVVVVHERAEAG
jgi:hypothetical protein